MTNKLLDLLHDVLFTVVCVLAVVCAIAVAVVHLWPGVESPTETHFRAACMEVNGKAVWNGRHWECIK